MSSEAIASAGQTIVSLLQNKMGNLNGKIALVPPSGELDQEICLSVCLYNVIGDPFMNNQEMIYAGTDVLQYPPLMLDLYYLLTPYSFERDLTARTVTEHKILGETMRVLYDHPHLNGPLLKGSLAGSRQELSIVMNPLNLAELTELRQMIPQHDFRPSVSYRISPVSIESKRSMEVKRVMHRKLKYAQLEGKL